MRTMMFTWQCTNEKCKLNDYDRWKHEYSPEEFVGVRGKGFFSYDNDTFERPVFKNYDHQAGRSRGPLLCPVCEDPVSKMSMGILDADKCFE